MKYVVDTHTLLWFLSGSVQLSRSAKAILDDSESELVLPAIAFAESVWIARHSKKSAIPVETLLKAINADGRIEIYPLDRSVVERTVRLTAINQMHDRQIVATALVVQDSGEDVALLTCDRDITQSKLIPIIW